LYLINYLNLQTVLQLFIAARRYRTGQDLVGVRDGVNCVFLLPRNEKFTHNLPYLTISVYVNGLRLTLLEDYTIEESGGIGTGYDTIIMNLAPYSDDHIIVDYVVAYG